MRLPTLSVPIIITAVLLPRGGRVHVLSILIRLLLALPLPLGLPYCLTVSVIVPIVVAQGVPVRIVPEDLPVDVVVVRPRHRALALSAYETAT